MNATCAFVGRAVADRRLFDPFRRIFKDRQTPLRRRHDGRTARRAERDRGLVTLHVNDRFERAAIRLVRVNQLRESIADRDEAGRHPERTRIVDDAEIDAS